MKFHLVPRLNKDQKIVALKATLKTSFPLLFKKSPLGPVWISLATLGLRQIFELSDTSLFLLMTDRNQ